MKKLKKHNLNRTFTSEQKKEENIKLANYKEVMCKKVMYKKEAKC